jgi:hypothetical protein
MQCRLVAKQVSENCHPELHFRECWRSLWDTLGATWDSRGAFSEVEFLMVKTVTTLRALVFQRSDFSEVWFFRGLRAKPRWWIPLLYYTILYSTILYYTILYYIILVYTILYYTILYYITLYYTILYYTILYYTRVE